MGDEFGCLPGKDEVAPGLIPPACHRFRRGRSVKHAVKFRRRKLAGVVWQLLLEAEALGKERPAPGIVVPSGGADQDPRHEITASPCQCFHRRASPHWSLRRRSGRTSCSYRPGGGERYPAGGEAARGG